MTTGIRLLKEKPIVVARNLSKSFGQVEALRDVSFEIPEGKIIGLLGPNGSGKTTLMRIMAGLYNSYEGTISIDEKKPGAETKEKLAYLPDRPAFSLKKNPDDVADIYEMFFKDFNREKYEGLLEKFQVKMDVPFKEMSKGVIDKVQVALALSRKARLYLLDEPLGGVDVLGREQILDTILENFDSKGTILIATHLISEIERLFDQVMVLKEGKIILEGECDEIRSKHMGDLEDAMRALF